MRNEIFFPLNRDQEDFFSIFARWLFSSCRACVTHFLVPTHFLRVEGIPGLSLICFCGHTLRVEGTEEVINTL